MNTVPFLFNTFFYIRMRRVTAKTKEQKACRNPKMDVRYLNSVSTKKIKSKGVSVNRIMQESDLYYYHAYHHYPKWIIQLAINSGMFVQKFRFYCSAAAVKVGLKKNIQ